MHEMIFHVYFLVKSTVELLLHHIGYTLPLHLAAVFILTLCSASCSQTRCVYSNRLRRCRNNCLAHWPRKHTKLQCADGLVCAQTICCVYGLIIVGSADSCIAKIGDQMWFLLNRVCFNEHGSLLSTSFTPCSSILIHTGLHRSQKNRKKGKMLP